MRGFRGPRGLINKPPLIEEVLRQRDSQHGVKVLVVADRDDVSEPQLEVRAAGPRGRHRDGATTFKVDEGGNVAGRSLTTTPALGSLAPQIVTQTADGAPRWLVDANGYPSGSFRALDEFWDKATLVRWTAGSVTYGAPTTENNSPPLAVTSTPLALSCTTAGWYWAGNLDLILTLRVMGTDAANAAFDFKMYDGSSAGIILGYNSPSIGGSGWQLFTEIDLAHNTTTDLTTLGSLVDGAWTTVVFEYHGSATDIGIANGGKATVRVTIGGVTAEVIDAPGDFVYVPSGDSAASQFDINVSRLSGSGTVNMGPLFLRYNYL